MFTQVGVKQLTDFLRTVTAASDLVDCTLVNCAIDFSTNACLKDGVCKFVVSYMLSDGLIEISQ